MKADRTVIVFGVFLFLLGFSAAWNGYGYIEIERGWSMVISGTVAFSAGLILIALGLVLRQLQIISASAAQVALFLAKATGNGGAAEPAPPPTAPPPPEPQAEAYPVEAPAEEAQAPVESYVSKPPAWMTRVTTYAASLGVARATEPPVAETESLADERRAWLEMAVAEQIAQETFEQESVEHESVEHESTEKESVEQEFVQQEFTHEQSPHEASPQDESSPAGTLHGEAPEEFMPWPEASGEGTHGEEAAAEPHAEWEPAIKEMAAEEALPENAPHPQGDEALEIHEAPSQPAQAPAEEISAEEETPPAPTRAIVGEYEAHGARYIMYADGSIDAETSHGVFHFASMDELKRFIEQDA
ncbi:hypothetical protein K9U39_09615 [Rhodoblastus acidophilus]|uniref:DUF308 domain-containing protein n=1 Tax=Candidatus Rhodoblastus alkanivorans TaxID=2954117 RepID=A0ABS9Z881_9HYPH|nr:hypothetical protein [Candidatus Rhodoblastus alkanivorans]MCI4677984.1 hypothetical protein [Candidatus Rhodoblastus alkanivorans]MCI4683879.1 hypothetical protein [Candidatus Rhodoblastus alkanivorans]MDI4641197.1 hypothetical protein [Rhodoblastus acidophilus]